jgi:competence/damage-inducible protein CinA-like protein
MKAEILAVGEELLAPGRNETNSIFLTERLGALGIPVVFRAIVGDDEDRLTLAIRQAVERAEIVLLSGGLGPTADDRTRDAAARALGLEMHLDSTLVAGLERRFQRRGVPMPEVNRRQAMVLDGAEVLENRRGSAPGLFVRRGDGRVVVLLPGPPRELEPLFDELVLPRLSPAAAGSFYRTRKLWVAGLPESSVEQRIVEVYRDCRNPLTTILASAGQVEIRLTASAPSVAEADGLNETLASTLRAFLGEHVFSENEESLEQVVGSLLAESGLRLSVAESLTGGLIAHRITQVPGASRYFDVGFVTYSNEAKTELLGVPSELFPKVGAVSEEVARSMAAGARSRAGSDIAVSVTGIAGPTGATETKPIGLVYAGLATPDGVRVERFQFPGDRRQIQRWTSQAALNLVRLELLRRGKS